MDPFNAIGTFVFGLIKEKILQSWIRLLFSMLASGVLTFMLVAGGVLCGVKVLAVVFGGDVAKAFPDLAAGDWALAIGMGMVFSAMMMIVVFRRDPLSKGMMLVLPSWEAAAEIQTNIEVIEKNEKEKKS